MWYIYNGILFSHRKEGNLALWGNMDGLEGIMLSDNVSKSEKDK